MSVLDSLALTRIPPEDEALRAEVRAFLAQAVQDLRVFIGHLRHKLEADPSAPRHLTTESGVGYRFVAES